MTTVINNTEVCYTIFSTYQNPKSHEEKGWKSVIAKGIMERVTKKEEIIYLLDLMEEQLKKLIEGAKGGTQKVFNQYKKGILSNPTESNLFKLHIKEITGRKIGI